MHLIGNFVINYAVYKFSPPGGERCDVTGQLFGDRCTDHTLPCMVWNTG